MGNNPWTFVDPWGMLKILAINTNWGQINNNNGFFDGHVWLSLHDTEKTGEDSFITRGLFPDDIGTSNDDFRKSHPNIEGLDPLLNPFFNIYPDIHSDREKNSFPTASRFFILSDNQYERFLSYINKTAYWRVNYNCSSWATDGINYILGINIDATMNIDDYILYSDYIPSVIPFIETPQFLYENLILLELDQPTSLDNPISIPDDPYLPSSPHIPYLDDMSIFSLSY